MESSSFGSSGAPEKSALLKLKLRKSVWYWVIGAFVVIGALLGISYFGQPYSAPQRIRVTNISAKSVTISWVTEKATPGVVVYGESAVFGPGVTARIAKGVAYDDRDYAAAALKQADESKLKDRASETVTVTKFGNYYVHHVTLRNLKSETQYTFLVGNGWWFSGSKSAFAGDEFTFAKTNSFTTFADSNDVQIPNPAYGKVAHEDSGYISDGAIYLLMQGLRGATPISATMNSQGGWYLDLSNIRSEDGKSLAPLLTVETLTERIMVEGGKSGIAEPFENSKAVDTPMQLIIVKKDAKQAEISKPVVSARNLVSSVHANPSDNCCFETDWHSCKDSPNAEDRAQGYMTWQEGYDACQQKKCGICGGAGGSQQNDNCCFDQAWVARKWNGNDRNGGNGKACCDNPDGTNCFSKWDKGWYACADKKCGLCSGQLQEPPTTTPPGTGGPITTPPPAAATCPDGAPKTEDTCGVMKGFKKETYYRYQCDATNVDGDNKADVCGNMVNCTECLCKLNMKQTDATAAGLCVGGVKNNIAECEKAKLDAGEVCCVASGGDIPPSPIPDALKQQGDTAETTSKYTTAGEIILVKKLDDSKTCDAAYITGGGAPSTNKQCCCARKSGQSVSGLGAQWQRSGTSDALQISCKTYDAGTDCSKVTLGAQGAANAIGEWVKVGGDGECKNDTGGEIDWTLHPETSSGVKDGAYACILNTTGSSFVTSKFATTPSDCLGSTGTACPNSTTDGVKKFIGCNQKCDDADGCRCRQTNTAGGFTNEYCNYNYNPYPNKPILNEVACNETCPEKGTYPSNPVCDANTATETGTTTKKCLVKGQDNSYICLNPNGCSCSGGCVVAGGKIPCGIPCPPRDFGGLNQVCADVNDFPEMKYYVSSFGATSDGCIGGLKCESTNHCCPAGQSFDTGLGKCVMPAQAKSACSNAASSFTNVGDKCNGYKGCSVNVGDQKYACFWDGWRRVLAVTSTVSSPSCPSGETYCLCIYPNDKDQTHSYDRIRGGNACRPASTDKNIAGEVLINPGTRCCEANCACINLDEEIEALSVNDKKMSCCPAYKDNTDIQDGSFCAKRGWAKRYDCDTVWDASANDCVKSTVADPNPCPTGGTPYNGATLPTFSQSIEDSESRGLLGQLISHAYAANESIGVVFYPDSKMFGFKDGGMYSAIIDKKTYFFDIPSAGQKYNLYIDKNGNGKYDKGDLSLDSMGYSLKFKRQYNVFNYAIKKGINFVSFPYLIKGASNNLASELLKLLNTNYQGSFLSISYYDNSSGRWNTLEMRGSDYFGDDFQVVPGVGYVLKSLDDLTVDLKGNAVDETVPVKLTAGWNLMSVHGSDTKYTAEKLIDSIDKVKGLDADNVSMWDASKSMYSGIQKEKDNSGTENIYGFDFSLTQLGSYFVRIKTGSGIWRP